MNCTLTPNNFIFSCVYGNCYNNGSCICNNDAIHDRILLRYNNCGISNKNIIIYGNYILAAIYLPCIIYCIEFVITKIKYNSIHFYICIFSILSQLCYLCMQLLMSQFLELNLFVGLFLIGGMTTISYSAAFIVYSSMILLSQFLKKNSKFWHFIYFKIIPAIVSISMLILMLILFIALDNDPISFNNVGIFALTIVIIVIIIISPFSLYFFKILMVSLEGFDKSKATKQQVQQVEGK